MKPEDMPPIAALFRDAKSVDQTVADLEMSGFKHSDIEVIQRDDSASEDGVSKEYAAAALAADFRAYGGFTGISPRTFAGSPAVLASYQLSEEDLRFFSSRVEDKHLVVIVRAGERGGLARTVLERNGGELSTAA